MLQEEYLDKLLRATYHSENIDLYDWSKNLLADDEDTFKSVRIWAHILVKEKLADYVDEQKTQMRITNFGRYWVMQGGYVNYLSDFHQMKEKRMQELQQQKMELLEERLKLTQYRLIGFWLTLVLSVIGMLSLALNLYFLINRK